MKKAQNMLEYLLIASIVAVACYMFVSKFDLKSIKNYVFMRTPDATDTTKIKIEPMTGY